MINHVRITRLLSCMSLFIGLVTTPAWANGDVFFEAEEIPGQTEYVVFGSIKDENGKFLDGVTVTIEVAEPHLSYDSYTNVLGRFRTLDVGRAVKDLGYTMDARKVSLTLFKSGYKMVRQLNRGRVGQNEGAVEVNFVMAPNDPVSAASSRR
ncbi:MAG: hypothetical protein K2P94_10475 [Rhodospirillaceae bacterium]|nr:hypothetical protein [Rhodospirillaceae bacterium]